MKIEACESNGNSRPVCGTDGQTYTSRCELLRVQCGGEAIAVAHRGPCSGKLDSN